MLPRDFRPSRLGYYTYAGTASEEGIDGLFLVDSLLDGGFGISDGTLGVCTFSFVDLFLIVA
jgi:hypothetical protein